MNYCTRCESFYQKAGTCNCYAEKEDAAPDDTDTVTIQWPPQPYTQPYPWSPPYWDPWSPTPWGSTWIGTDPGSIRYFGCEGTAGTQV